MPMRRVRARIRGRVQGIAYRAYATDEATRLGLSGWVRNLPDGSVELEAEGSAVDVDLLLAWCRHGPPAARVTEVEVEECALSGAQDRFRIAH